MPSVREMFPSKFLSFTDLPANQLIYVTIRGVVPYQAQARQGGMPQPANGMPVQAPGVEVAWLLWFHELEKPLYMKSVKANKIATILGSENTDHWTNRRIGIYRGVWSNGGKSGEGLMIDDRPVPAEVPTKGIQGSKPRMAPIPVGHVKRFIAMIGEQGETWDSFLLWLKRVDLAAAGACFGQDLSAIPGFVLPLMKGYIDHLGAPAAPPANQLPERVDAATGEVYTPPARASMAARYAMPDEGPAFQEPGTPARQAAPTPQPAAAPRDPHQPFHGHEPITEDDIPF